jgi:Uma2 family endonuclease
MAIVTTHPMTAEEFYDWANRPEHADRHFELEAGEVFEEALAGERHGVVCANSVGVLGAYVRQRKRGHVCGNNMGLVLERSPDTVLGPDISLYLESRKYSEMEVGYPVRLPALVVEVLTPPHRIGKMLKRTNLFLAKGVQMVWLIDAEARSIAVWRLGPPLPVVIDAGEELTGFDVLPEFRCPVADFFLMSGDEEAAPAAG